MQYDWFTDFLRRLSETKLSPTDEAFMKTIDVPMKKYYYDTYAYLCMNYMNGNPRKLLWCYRQLNNYHYPKSAYLKWFINSIIK